MEENTSYRKKLKIFITAAVIIGYGLNILANIINAQFTVSSMEDYYGAQWIRSAVSLGVVSLTAVAFFIIGKILTSSSRKALIFMGSVYFARTATGIVSSLFRTICQILMRTGILNSMTYANILAIIEVIFLPLIAYVAYFVFSALEGMNSRFPSQSLDTIKTSASRARIGYFVCIAASFVAVINNIINMMYAYLGQDFAVSNTATVISLSVDWFVNVLAFVLFCIVCYKTTKSHVEAMGLAAIIKVSDAILAVLGSLINTVMNVIIKVLNMGSEENMYMYSTVASISGWVSTVLVTVLSIVLAMYFIGLFFPKVKAIRENEESSDYEEPLKENIMAEEVSVSEISAE